MKNISIFCVPVGYKSVEVTDVIRGNKYRNSMVLVLIRPTEKHECNVKSKRDLKALCGWDLRRIWRLIAYRFDEI